jgi:hypothetical protein
MPEGLVTYIRPEFKWRSPARQAAWLLPLLVVVISVGNQSSTAVVLSVVAGLVAGAALVGVAALNLRSAGFGLVDGSVVHRRSPRRVVSIAKEPRSLRVVRIERGDDPGHCWQVWSGPEGAVALDERLWNIDELGSLARHLAVTVEDEAEPISPRELVRRFPGTMPWYVKHHALAVALLVGLPTAAYVALSSI